MVLLRFDLVILLSTRHDFFYSGLYIIKLNILTTFYEDWIKLSPVECSQGFTKI